MTFYEACRDLTIATRTALWYYCPEAIFALGFLAGMIVMGLLLLVVIR